MPVTTGKSAKTRVNEVDRIERARQVLELARQRYSYAEIAAELGISDETARRDVFNAISTGSETNKELGKIFVAEAVNDLLAIWKANLQNALSGNEKAAHTIDRAIHRIALLTGSYPADTPSENNNTQVNLIVNVQQPAANDDNTTPPSNVIVGSVSKRQLSTPTSDDTL